MIDSHDIRPGQEAWALINETESVFSPLATKRIRFDRLLPYQGFSYHEIDTGEWKESTCEAIFAENRAKLIEHHLAKTGEKIDALIKEQERLASFLTTDDAVTLAIVHLASLHAE